LLSYDQNNWEGFNRLNSGLVNDTIIEIDVDSNNDIWAYDVLSFLHHFDGNSWNNSFDITGNFSIKDLAIGADQRVWVAGRKGISVYHNNEWNLIDTSNSKIANTFVNHIIPDSAFVWVSQSTGIHRYEEDCAISTNIQAVNTAKNFSLNVFPNPSDQEVNFQFHLNTYSNVSLMIYNNLGELVTQSDILNNLIGDIDLSLERKGLPAGIYFYSLFINQKNITGRVILMN